VSHLSLSGRGASGLLSAPLLCHVVWSIACGEASDMAKMSGGEAAVQALLAQGVDTLFVLPGGRTMRCSARSTRARSA
jgi:hypothetical protein